MLRVVPLDENAICQTIYILIIALALQLVELDFYKIKWFFEIQAAGYFKHLLNHLCLCAYIESPTLPVSVSFKKKFLSYAAHTRFERCRNRCLL